MKTISAFVAAWLGLAGIAAALPNSVLGGVQLAESPLDGVDLTDRLLEPEVWEEQAALPGDWRDEGRIGGLEIRHLLAQPKLFGRQVLLLRENRREGALESLEATFADAGSYFGYFDEALPQNLTRRQREEELQRRLAGKQEAFREIYRECVEGLRASLATASGNDRPKRVKIGRTRTLRAEPEEWRVGKLVVRLLAAENRLVRLTIQPLDAARGDWLDREVATLDERRRLEALAAGTERQPDGTVLLGTLRPIPQGFQPYCGLNTLAMAARHFGMHLDEDWLAVAGGFQNTGSAHGSNMLRLYQAVAAEAGFGMDRSNRFDMTAVRRAIDSGLPPIVWRRFSHERNRLHDRFGREHGRNPDALLPDPTDPAEQASWPDENAPLHASVIVGYHPERKEILFLESWSGRDVPRRMRVEEMEATTYLCFVFTP